ncbi:hypothetical protein BURMUCF2_A0087 [Burkholderia multivorans CF2]|nr:hypothetical protein BURMUCF2_A0087 [Burkholderia multivorans CF2]
MMWSSYKFDRSEASGNTLGQKARTSAKLTGTGSISTRTARNMMALRRRSTASGRERRAARFE